MGGRPGRAGRLRFRVDPWLAELLDLFTILSRVYTPANPSRHSRHATKGGGAMRISKIWLITLLLAVFMAGCGGGNSYSGGGPALPGDTTPPTVRSTDPGDTATGLGTNSKLVANFSEAVDPATCTITTFTVTQGVTSVPASTVSCAGKTATFVPQGSLTGGA